MGKLELILTADLIISTGSKKNNAYEIIRRTNPQRPYLAFPETKNNITHY